MEVWFYLTRRNHGREANTRGEKILKNLHPRSSEARRESFALLTKTYHGSRVTGDVDFVSFTFPVTAFTGTLASSWDNIALLDDATCGRNHDSFKLYG